MKKKSDSQKFVKGLRGYFKAGLFLPIFYTSVFILVITSLIVLPDYGLLIKIIGVVLSLIIIFFFWFLFGYERKNEKKMKVYIDEIEMKLESQNNVDEEKLSMNEISERNEEDYLSEEQISIFTKKSHIFLRYQVYLILSIALFSLGFRLKDLLDFPSWLNVLILSMFGFLIILSGFLGIKTYINLRKYADEVSKD